MSEMMMTKTMTNSPQESTESDSSSEKIMSEMMMMTRTMSYSPQESTESESESDSSRRDSTTSSSSDLSDGSHDSSGSPPLKKPRLATVFEPLFDDEYEAMFMSLMDFDDEEPKVKYGPREDETFAKLVLAYYKDTKGEDYELSKIRSMMPFPPREQVIFQDGSRQESSDGGTHLNFFARPRGCNEPEYLFYGELLHWPIDPQVVDCFKFPLGTHDGVDLILHPPYIVCPDCDYLGRYELNDDDYEYK